VLIYFIRFKSLTISGIILSLLCFSSCFQNQSNQSLNSEHLGQSDQINIAFYNVENLLDTIDSPKVKDKDYTPNGKYKWTSNKYKSKIKGIAKVINLLAPDLLGLAEIENYQVLEDLKKHLKDKDYEIIHRESHDPRGIDVALLVNKSIFEVEKINEVKARLSNGGYAGPRNILKTTLSYEDQQLDVYVNHWPSRRNGKEENRMAFSNALANDINTDHQIVLMGDFNDNPTDESIKSLSKSLPNYNNPFDYFHLKGEGTCTHRAEWYLFDQIITNLDDTFTIKDSQIADFDFLKNDDHNKYYGHPNRSFEGTKYDKTGFSDHFPVSITLTQQK